MAVGDRIMRWSAVKASQSNQTQHTHTQHYGNILNYRLPASTSRDAHGAVKIETELRGCETIMGSDHNWHAAFGHAERLSPQSNVTIANCIPSHSLNTQY